MSQADLFNLSVNHCYITEEQQDHLPHHRSSWDAETNDLDRLTATLALQFPYNGSVPAVIDTSTQQEVTFTLATVALGTGILALSSSGCLRTDKHLLAFVAPGDQQSWGHGLPQHAACLQGHPPAVTDSQATLGLRLAALKSLLNALPQGSSNQMGEATAYSQRTAGSARTSYLSGMKIALDYNADHPFYPACMGMYPTLPANSVPYIRCALST